MEFVTLKDRKYWEKENAGNQYLALSDNVFNGQHTLGHK